MNPITYIPQTIGIGIICGLEPLVNDDCSVSLSSGYGISSYGKMIQFPAMNYKYVCPYEKEIKGLISAGSEAEVWELMENAIDADGNPVCENLEPLAPQAIKTERFTDDKVLLLYLEDEGQQLIKPLVIDKDELWEILQKKYQDIPTCLLHSPIEEEDVDLLDFGEEEFFSGQKYFFQINSNTALRPVDIARFGFAKGEEKACEKEELYFSINGEIPNKSEETGLFEYVSHEFITLINQLVTELNTCIKALHAPIFHNLIPANQRKFLEDYMEYLSIKRWPEFYRNAPTKYHIQYFWDFVRDIALSYNEMVQEICQFMAECGEHRELFPYHLLIGELTEDVAFGRSVFRNHFMQPPVYNLNADRLQKIRFLHWRMVMMIKCFYIPGVEPNDIADDHFAQINFRDSQDPDKVDLSRVGVSEDTPELKGEIKITPARAYGVPLDEGTIPFYYYTAKDPNSIIPFWSYEATKCASLNQLYSYHTDEEESYTTLCAVKLPFGYEARSFPFYRIEGHIGDSVADVKKALFDLKARYNLEFEVLVTTLDEYLQQKEGEEEEIYLQNRRFRGTEHMAGVERGGTFLLVYEFEQGDCGLITGSPVRLDVSYSNACCLQVQNQFICGKLEFGESVASDDLSLAGLKVGITDFEENFLEVTHTNEEGEFCFFVTPSPDEEHKYTIQVIDGNFLYEEEKVSILADGVQTPIPEELCIFIQPGEETEFFIPNEEFTNTFSKFYSSTVEAQAAFEFHENKYTSYGQRLNKIRNSLRMRDCLEAERVEEEYRKVRDFFMTWGEFSAISSAFNSTTEGLLGLLESNSGKCRDAIFCLLELVILSYWDKAAFTQPNRDPSPNPEEDPIISNLVADLSVVVQVFSGPRIRPTFVINDLFKHWQFEQINLVPPIILSPIINFPIPPVANLPGVEVESNRVAAETGAVVATADDLLKVKGIGPGTLRVLEAAGINSFDSLASTPEERLKEILREAGPTFASRDATHWAQQAEFLRDGKLDELRDLQNII